jgi:hypothetical protein
LPLDLAAVCEEAANNIEDRMPAGDPTSFVSKNFAG